MDSKSEKTSKERAQNHIFSVEVLFYKNVRNTMPVTGYRPHIIMEDDKEYLGIRFFDIEKRELGQRGVAMIECMYEEQGVNYSKIIAGKSFKVMEGPHVVGEGRVLK